MRAAGVVFPSRICHSYPFYLSSPIPSLCAPHFRLSFCICDRTHTHTQLITRCRELRCGCRVLVATVERNETKLERTLVLVGAHTPILFRLWGMMSLAWIPANGRKETPRRFFFAQLDPKAMMFSIRPNWSTTNRRTSFFLLLFSLFVHLNSINFSVASWPLTSTRVRIARLFDIHLCYVSLLFLVLLPFRTIIMYYDYLHRLISRQPTSW